LKASSVRFTEGESALLRTYWEFAKKSFQNNVVYRADYFAGVINTMVMIFVNIAIWKAIYEEEAVLSGIGFRVITTYIVLSFLMQTMFVMDEYLIENKVRSGLIATDLLKPVNFRFYIFSYNIGTLLFRTLMQLLPALILSIFLFKLLPPFSLLMAGYFVISAFLAYLVLYNLNFIVWVSSFWFYWTFSLITIKDALLMVLSGALLPLWFMPSGLSNIIKLTPFDSIYFTPISIYLGQIPVNEILFSLGRQAIWVIILLGVGQLLWNRATKRLVIQGG
jgi:ABC-2 type transport system permease protein